MELNLKATVQVDLDGIWTIYRYHGIEKEIWPDPVFTQALPRFLELFSEMQVKATFFIVGIDVTNPEKANMIRRIHNAGHEIANHSYSHRIPFIELSEEQMKREITETNQILESITGKVPEGYRSPAYSVNEKVISLLTGMNFKYDASIFPTKWAKVLHKIEVKKSGVYPPKGYYGGDGFGTAPIRPYSMDSKDITKRGDSSITEIPLSVIPIIRSPMHRSISQFIGMWYFSLGVRLNKIFGNPLSVLFHGVDLVDSLRDEKLPEIKWITTPVPQRTDEIRKMIKVVRKHYTIVPTCQLITN